MAEKQSTFRNILPASEAAAASRDVAVVTAHHSAAVTNPAAFTAAAVRQRGVCRRFSALWFFATLVLSLLAPIV